MKIIFITLGFISLGLGIAGIFLPVLPTTPFVLLSAFIFAKTSKRFHTMLINHKTFGKIIEDYNKYKGIKMKYKIISILSMLISFIVVCIFTDILHAKIAVFIILSIVSFCLLRMNTAPR